MLLVTEEEGATLTGRTFPPVEGRALARKLIGFVFSLGCMRLSLLSWSVKWKGSKAEPRTLLRQVKSEESEDGAMLASENVGVVFSCLMALELASFPD